MVRSAVLRALGPAAAFRASLALLRTRPLAISAVGLALYTSATSVCCGFGIIAAPWFACELLSLLISAGLGRPLSRSSAWLWAGFVQMVAIIVLSSVTSLALMSLAEGAIGNPLAERLAFVPVQLGQGLLVMAVAGSLVLSLTVCFEHAPAILIERGGGFIAALLESARLVSRHGLFRTLCTSAVAHGLPMASALVVIVVLARRVSLGASVALLVLLMPLLVFSLVVGQGMMVASYLHLREQVTDPRAVPASGEPSKLATALWAVLLSAVALGPVAVSAALLKPAAPEERALPSGLPVLLSIQAEPTLREVYIPESALTLQLSRAAVRVSGSDGGGAGTIPLPQGWLRSVRVVRLSGPLPELSQRLPSERAYGIEIQMGDGRVWSSWVDEAGVRLDDSFARRLSVRLSPARGLLLVLCFLWTAIWIVRSLPPQARIRRRLVGTTTAVVHAEFERRLRAVLRARALGTALWLVLPALGSLTIGLSALLR